jgi:hypothetical protein
MSYESACERLREKSEREETKTREIARKPSNRVGKNGDVGKRGISGKTRPDTAGNKCGIGERGANGKKGRK